MSAAMNTDPPGVRCGQCGGKARVDGLGWITCAGKDQPYPFEDAGRCSWHSHDPRRRRHPLWWRLRVWLRR